MMTGKKSTIGICLCLVGAAVLFANTAYIQAKAKLAQYLIADAWESTVKHQQTHQQRLTVKPWAWADTYPVAKLTVKKQAVQQYVLAGASGSPLAFGPGLYAGTQLPNATAATTQPDAVIAGHHNTHFAFLKQLIVGDTLTLENVGGQLFTYQVTAIDTYDIRFQRLPAYHSGKTLQLVTCAPRFVGETQPPLRLVVTAQLINLTAPLLVL